MVMPAHSISSRYGTAVCALLLSLCQMQGDREALSRERLIILALGISDVWPANVIMNTLHFA